MIRNSHNVGQMRLPRRTPYSPPSPTLALLVCPAVHADATPKSKISEVLAPATKEVRDMLKDNLYDKFRTTEEYKQIATGVENVEQGE